MLDKLIIMVQSIANLGTSAAISRSFDPAKIADNIRSLSTISQKSKEALLEFPVIITDALSLDASVLIMKALERKYASFLKLAMELNNEYQGSKIGYIRQFHRTRGLFESVRPKQYDILKDLEHDPIESIKRTKLTENKTALYVSAEIKKANELVPTPLRIDVMYKDKDGKVINTPILLGVKAKLHPVPNEEMVMNLYEAIHSKQFFFKMIQWTTGEIRLVKDLLFSFDKLKDLAIRMRPSSKKPRVFELLKAKSRYASMIKYSPFAQEFGIIPNCTIVISMEEADELLHNHNIDVFTNTGVLANLMHTFFLLGFVVADPAAELAYFYFDGDENFEKLSFRALKREANMKNEIKALLSLLHK